MSKKKTARTRSTGNKKSHATRGGGSPQRAIKPVTAGQRKATKATGGAKKAKKAAGRKTPAPGRPKPVDTGESLEQRVERAKTILRELKKLYGPVDCALTHESALQLLVATILSAQSTDENVNRITPRLWAKYPGAAELAAVPAADLEDDIRSTGFFRQKTKSIQGACRLIVEEFGGGVPDTMDDLLRLPGVARKTANVVLGTWFGKNEGVVVDTHVGRLAGRLGLTWRARDDKDAVKIETDLMEVLPRKEWTYFSHAMIRLGRQTCTARKPDCNGCRLAGICPSAGSFA